jgi:hypothetical protein
VTTHLSASSTYNNVAVCTFGVSNTAATGPVGNIYDKTRSAGGSTSGCGVLIAIGEADMGIGGDQGGSIRIVSEIVFAKQPFYSLPESLLPILV